MKRTSTPPAINKCFFVTLVGGFGAGFDFPQCGHVLAPTATTPPHAGQVDKDGACATVGGVDATEGCGGATGRDGRGFAAGRVRTELLIFDAEKSLANTTLHAGHSPSGATSVGLRV